MSETIRPMLDERQLAEMLNMAVATLRRWRMQKTGPSFVRLGGSVRYRREDIDRWLKQCTEETKP